VIPLLSAFVWLRWRLLLNGLRGGRRQDVLERLSRVASLLAPLAVIGFFALAGVALAGLAFAAGFLISDPGGDPQTVRSILLAGRLQLLVVTGVLILIPLGRSFQGGLPGTDRLLLLPIPRALLHLTDVAAGLFDPWMIFLVPEMAALALGIAWRGRFLAAAIALAAAPAMLAALTCLSSLATFLMQWVLRDRRRAEAAALIFAVAVTAGGMVPVFLTHGGAGEDDVRIALPSAAWIVYLPSEIFTWILRASLQGRPGAAAAGIAILLAEAAALLWISSKVYARLLTSTASSVRMRRGLEAVREGVSLPGLPPAAAGVAHAQITTALRTLRGRMGVFLNAPLLLLLGLMMHRLAGVIGTRSPIPFTIDGPSLFGMGVLLGVLALLPILMNQFASDRAGLTLQFLAPVADQDLLMGKAAGGIVLAGSSSLLCLAAAWVASPRAPLLLWICAAAAGGATILLSAPVAALLSLLFPRRADLNKLGSGGNAHAAAGLLGAVVIVVVSLPGSALLLAGSWLEVPALAAGGALLWLALCALLSWASVRVLSPVLRARRESLLLVAAGG